MLRRATGPPAGLPPPSHLPVPVADPLDADHGITSFSVLLPLMDAAKQAGATLLHKDPEFRAIPELAQEWLGVEAA